MRRIQSLVLSLIVFFPLSVSALSLDTLRSYSCDFEDTVQNLTWHFPKAIGVGHNWCVDTAINNGGKYGLYVTTDNGQTASYKNQSALVVAYTDIILRPSSDKYLLSFDWMAAGYTFLENDGLYVFWMPAVDDLGDSIQIKSIPTTAIPSTWEPYALRLNAAKGVDYLRGKSTWQAWLSQDGTQGDSRLAYSGQHCRLVFAWRSGTDGPVNPAACIDNIVIADPRACRPPKKLNIEKHGKDSLIMSWKRDTCCQEYEVGVYSYEDSVWIINETTDTFFVHQQVPEGFCDFYVRTKCWDTISHDYFYSAKVQASDFIYYPDNHCVDYITMTDDNCYISTVKTQSVMDDYKFQKEMVDNGSDEISSRHTHHYSKMETDPRTGGRLKTVPAGELCSSRLGNWNNGGEAERAEFKFHVNAKKNPIMILKYAVVLEKPDHDVGKHPGDHDLADPRFTLKVLKNSHSIGDCASADFTASWVKEGWHDTTVNVIDKDGKLATKNVVWKDWTTIGINLRDYDGETLTIQLTTYDCSFSAHFGYAYFVLGCSSDDLDLTGESCSGKQVEDFTAPAGFKYRWYKKTNPDVTESTEQTFHIESMDTCVYGVDVIFPEDSDCYFTLDASSQPHIPVSKWSWEYQPKGCQHYVVIKNNAHVLHIKRWEEGRIEYSDTSYTVVDTCYWNWAGLLPDTTLMPGDSILIPVAKSGNYPVSLTTTYKNCEAVVLDTIRVPELDTVPLVEHRMILKGDSILFKGKYYKEAGFHPFTTINYQGCEKTDSLILEIHENIKVTLESPFICYKDTQVVLNYEMEGARTGTRYTLYLADSLICDSMPIPNYGYDPIEFTVPKNLQPNYYPISLVFIDSLTATDTTGLIKDWKGGTNLAVRYPSSVMTQRWNDVLAVKNADYIDEQWNFTSFQWYVDNQPISGATGSILYQTLDSTRLYQVMLTRSGVGALLSCPCQPVINTQINNMPTFGGIVDKGAAMNVPGRGIAKWYDYSGTLVQSESYDGSTITAPSRSGLYLLQLTTQSAPDNQQSPITNQHSSILRILVR